MTVDNAIISTEVCAFTGDTVEWHKHTPAIPVKLLTDLNYNVVWCECPQCSGLNIYSVLLSDNKHYGLYCNDCSLTYGSRIIKKGGII